jgi:hypothetical protein
MKTLKIWNGRSHGNKYHEHHAYVAAYSMKQAHELLSVVFFGEGHHNLLSHSEIKNYYSECWENAMNGIERTEPCVYLCDETKGINSKPFRVI